MSGQLLPEYQARFPEHAALIGAVFAEVIHEAATVPPAPAATGQPGPAPETGVDPARTSLELAPLQADSMPSVEQSPGLPEIPGYEIINVLGRGGMGIVYKARQVALKRVVALKMILAGGHADPQELARFRTEAEAEAVARLQHANIVQIHEVGDSGGLPYFTLEYLPGGSLSARLAKSPQQPRDTAWLVEQLARGVHCAHHHGIVHRDLKPANVLMAADGTPKVTDFGLAKQVEGGSGLTQSGAVMGTPSYMAPEQARGETKAVGPAADVYALGAILYECLTGRPPFRGPTPADTLVQVLNEEPVPVRRLQPKVPKDLETICHKCLQKDPKQRYASAEELAEDLRRFQAGESIKARRVRAVERLWKWARRRPAMAALVGMTALTALLGVTALALVRAIGISQVEAEARQIDELLLPIGHHDGVPSPAEEQALAKLANQSSDNARIRFLERGLTNAETAERLVRRSKSVMDAVVSKDAGLRRRVWELLQARLLDEGADLRIRLACAHLGLALGDPDPQFARAAAHVVLKAMWQTVDPSALSQLAGAVAAFAERLDAAGAREAALTALELIGNAKNTEVRWHLAPKVGALVERLDAAKAWDVAHTALELMDKADNRGSLKPLALSLLAKAVSALARRLEAEEAASVSAVAVLKLLKQMGMTGHPEDLGQLAEPVGALAKRLDAAGAREAALTALELMGNTSSSDAKVWLAYAFSALAERLDAAGAEKVTPRLLEQMGKTGESRAESYLAQPFRSLAMRLDAAGAKASAQSALERMGKTIDPYALSQMAKAVGALAGQLDAAGAKEVAPKFLEQMGKTTNPGALCGLSEAVGASAARMNKREVAALLTAYPLPAPAAKELLPELEKIAGRKFASIDDAVKWFRDAGAGKDAPGPRDQP